MKVCGLVQNGANHRIVSPAIDGGETESREIDIFDELERNNKTLILMIIGNDAKDIS